MIIDNPTRLNKAIFSRYEAAIFCKSLELLSLKE